MSNLGDCRCESSYVEPQERYNQSHVAHSEAQKHLVRETPGDI